MSKLGFALLVMIGGTSTALAAPTISVSPAGPVAMSARERDPAVATQTFTITNAGDGTLDVTALAISGSTDFTIPTLPTLPAHLTTGSLQVTVRFDPSATGAITGSLDITNSDTPTSIELDGTGTTGIINAADFDFGIVTDGTSQSGGVLISNIGLTPKGPLTVTSATITNGAGVIAFGNTGGCTGGTSCTFTQPFQVTSGTISAPIVCAPGATASGTTSATITFVSDSDADVTANPTATVTCTAGRSVISVDKSALAFGNQLINTSSAGQTVTVTNLGTQNLTYTVTKSPNLSVYGLSGCVTNCNVPPTPGSNTKQFTVVFTPTATGEQDTTLNIASNDPDHVGLPNTVAVTGAGVAPTIQTNSPVQFGNVEVNVTSGMLQITAKNIGTADLLISNAALTAGGTDFTVAAGTAPLGAQATTVTPNSTVTWNATCKPTTTGNRTGNFQIMSNASNGVLANVSLTCTGQAGIIATNPAAPTALAFGNIREGNSSTLQYHLLNTGNLAINTVAAALDPADVGYSLDPTTPVPASLAPGANIPLNIIFAPVAGADGGPATVTFTGKWGTSNTTTTAVLDITGTGLAAGFALSPAVVDFGDLRFDTTPTKTFCITNTDAAAVQIKNSISISPHMGTASGEFVVQPNFLLQTTCGVGGTATTLPHTLNSGEIIQVTVKADPANRIGAMAADLTVTSDLPTNPTRTLLLQGNATTAGISVMPSATLDFGAVDIDAGPVTQSITIKNTSADASLDLSAFVKTASTVITVTLPPGTTTLAPGAQLDLAFTYHPTVEKPVGQTDSMTVSHNIAGILNGPPNETLTIQGRGIDRHIDVAMAAQIPDAFRNPGDTAPVVPITITNTGEALLSISAVMISGDPVWTLVDGNPSDVMGGQSVAFHVKFAPTEAGPAPPGELTIMNNDNGKPMAVVDLRGNGLNRNVDLLPNGNGIDMGFVGVGVPVTKDGVLQVASMDGTNTFHIRTIELDDASGPFTIDNAPSDVELAPDGQQAFAVTFTPTTLGDFSTTARLFLDMDPTEQDKVTITGHAVFVDAHGGGGCSAGGAAGGAMIAVVIALIALRRRRMLAPIVAPVLAPVLAMLSIPFAVRADNVDLSVFHPTPATTSDGFQVQSADVGKSGDWVALAVVSLATDPLVFTAYDSHVNPDGSVTLVPINDDHAVHRRTQYDLGFAYAFLDRFEAGARMPLYTQTGETITDEMAFGAPPARGTSRGDLTLHGKARLVKTDPAILAAEIQLTLPTATDGQYTGLDKPSGRAVALGTFAVLPRLTLTANAGAVIRARAQLGNVEQGSGMTWGGGASFRLLDELWIAAEIFGELIPKGTHDHDPMLTAQTLSPIEWLGGFNYRPDRRFTIGVAVGRGVTTGFGAPDLRGVLAMTFAPGSPALAPIHIEIPVIDGDRDGDGIPDSKDKCPDEPEDKDMFEDQDGCPDPDNDHDGIPDAVDKCPLDPEDFDGFQDADGCPDKDNDGDGIPDAMDKCPNEPEDKDGFEDLDGCPDPDNDKDGIPDVKDKCPNEPETINGFQDDDGCPDKGDSLVVISPDRVETMEAIQFTGAKLAKTSFNLLGQIAANLRAHTEIARLRITAHVNPTRNSDKDQELSDKRAQAVRDWLVQWGIDAKRVEARGFGGDKPMVPATQKGAASINDRLEFIILERK